LRIDAKQRENPARPKFGNAHFLNIARLDQQAHNHWHNDMRTIFALTLLAVSILSGCSSTRATVINVSDKVYENFERGEAQDLILVMNTVSINKQFDPQIIAAVAAQNNGEVLRLQGEKTQQFKNLINTIAPDGYLGRSKIKKVLYAVTIVYVHVPDLEAFNYLYRHSAVLQIIENKVVNAPDVIRPRREIQ
jgi:hypothetical protein